MQDLPHPCRPTSSPRLVCLVLSVLGFVARALAQDGEPPATGNEPWAAAARTDLARVPPRVPIHTAPHGADPRAYGIWAAGKGYKVSFHGGFVFYPRLPRGHSEHLPLRWQTQAITVGDRALIDTKSEPAHAHTDWRYEYRWPGVTEAYDVREDGVEQTFVIAERPAGHGDLVIAGRMDTRLTPQLAIASVHGPVTFADATGQPVASYGAAFAVDALGRRAPLMTANDGTDIRLTVPEAWLQAAAFPVTIDPLTAPVGLSEDVFSNVTIARENTSSSSNVMVTFTVAANGDNDGYALLYSDTMRDGVLVFVDLDVTVSAVDDAVFAGGASRWVVACRRVAGSGLFLGRVYFHDRGNLDLNTGTIVELPQSSQDQQFAPMRLGGSSAGRSVLLVFRAAFAASTFPGIFNFEAWGAMIAADTRSSGTPVRIAAMSSLVGHDVDVSRDNSAGDQGWLVAFQNSSGGLSVLRVEPTTLGAVAPVQVQATCAFPQVDGRDGRFLVAHTGGIGIRLVTRRVDWPAGATAPTLGAEHVIETNVGLARGLAFDTATRSHWCLVYENFAFHTVRLGSTGAVTERATLGPGQGGLGVLLAGFRSELATYDPRARDFQLAYPEAIPTGARLQVRRLRYPTDAMNVAYGQGCNNAGLTMGAERPLAGSEFFQVSLRGGTAFQPVLPNGTPCVLTLSLAPASIPIHGTTCTRLVSELAGDVLAQLPAHMLFGQTMARFPLPDDPLLLGNLFGQWTWVGRASVMGASPGLRMQVR